jgi:hypothetical protein
MRGWLSALIVGRDGTNWGLLQLSDKYEGEFTEADEKHFISFTELVSETLEALWDVRNLRKNAPAGNRVEAGDSPAPHTTYDAGL